MQNSLKRREEPTKRSTEYPYYPGSYAPLDLDAYLPVSSGCWRYLGHKGTGYVQVWLKEWREGSHAHRIFYLRKHGPIPRGHVVHHLCENKWCVNPDHLVAMSPAEHADWHREHAARTLNTRHATERQAARP